MSIHKPMLNGVRRKLLKLILFKIILLILIHCKIPCFAQEFGSIRLGIFQIQDSVNEKHLCINEYSIEGGLLFNKNYYVGIEINSYLLPSNYNIWGMSLDSDLSVAKNYVNIGYFFIVKDKYLGAILGYNLGLLNEIVNITRSNISINDKESLKLMFTSGFCLSKELNDLFFAFDIGFENSPGQRYFLRLGITVTNLNDIVGSNNYK